MLGLVMNVGQQIGVMAKIVCRHMQYTMLHYRDRETSLADCAVVDDGIVHVIITDHDLFQASYRDICHFLLSTNGHSRQAITIALWGDFLALSTEESPIHRSIAALIAGFFYSKHVAARVLASRGTFSDMRCLMEGNLEWTTPVADACLFVTEEDGVHYYHARRPFSFNPKGMVDDTGFVHQDILEPYRCQSLRGSASLNSLDGGRPVFSPSLYGGAAWDASNQTPRTLSPVNRP